MATFSAVATASANATLVQPRPGAIVAWSIVNTSAAIRYVRLYNKATVPAPASDAALIVLRIPLAAGQRSDISFSAGSHWFTSGIGFDITGGAADTDVTATTAGDVTINLVFV